MSGDAPAPAACSAAVLAGGRGERFGGDKPLAPFRGSTLLGHLLGELAGIGFAQLLVAAKDPQRLAAALGVHRAAEQAGEKLGAPSIRAGSSPSIEWIPDPDPGFNPLAGLCAALRASRCGWLFACAADMPFAADRPLLMALCAAAPGEAVVAPVHGGELQPLCALWNRARALEAAEALLREGKGGPRALLERLGARRLEWAEARPFLDVDTREALAELDGSAE